MIPETFYNLPHIIIAYEAGAGGIFLSRLIHRSKQAVPSDVAITASGGVLPHDQIDTSILFLGDSDADDDQYKFIIKSNIFKSVIGGIIDATVPGIFVSHDTLGTRIFKEVFPNAKVLVISSRTAAEKKVIKVNHTVKWFINREFNPKKTSNMAKWVDEWQFNMLENVAALVPDAPEIIQLIKDDMHNPKYKDILLYGTLMTWGLFRAAVELAPDVEPFNGAIELPYSCFMKSNEELFINTLKFIMEIDETQEIYLRSNFTKYCGKQDQRLLTDQDKFYSLLAIRVRKQLTKLGGPSVIP